MARYREALPQLSSHIFLCDSGLETDLIFHKGVTLPDFAAFTLLADDRGREHLRTYFAEHLVVAAGHGIGIVLESPTWRASADWGARLGYDAAALAEANRQAMAMLVALREEHGESAGPVVLSGNIGPRRDGYRPDITMTAEEAHAYHRAQVETFASTPADLVTALTLTTVAEAVGIARAARDVDMPVVLSFTVETDGKLPDGTRLATAVHAVDHDTDGYPAYYMINCAHPTHFADAIPSCEDWMPRIRGVRANASRMSHAELDDAERLDEGNPAELAANYVDLRVAHPAITILGGCCGTDVRHIRAIAELCAAAQHA